MAKLPPPSIQLVEDVSFPICVSFVGAFFCQQADFRNALFSGTVEFDKSRFVADANFSGAEFLGKAHFRQVLFEWFADFSGHALGSIGPNEKGAARFVAHADFQQTVFVGGARFAGRQFVRGVEFISAVFLSHSDFSGFIVRRGASFQDVYFVGNARFAYATIVGAANFDKSVFLNGASFVAANVGAGTSLENVEFGKVGRGLPNVTFGWWPERLRIMFLELVEKSKTENCVPDFRSAQFAIAPNLGQTHVVIPDTPPLSLRACERMFLPSEAWRVADSMAAAKLRRMQELAADGHHHLVEKRFFRAELLCRRGHEATVRETLMINLFELFSMCGLSFRRPVMWWLGLFAVFFAVYGGFAGLFEAGWSVEDSFHLINYTFSNATPVLGVIKANDSAAVQALFTGGQPPWVTLLAGVHNLISTIFLFFALLAIRNYFKLG
ncbi:pentapeptide repeat-containing protein [Kordiimonas lipolytica]|uniref:Pentapeptide repeat-containing protein n=1 Tax=Kordiimonas lipolytica TaxID=1662421 RepID=A0ABV8UCV2_9PROT|nr:pentapeptide repeat-containing protein [Kordiimonas lipolytica]